eukprot:scaffold103896_cov47-Prasinocladus_malaysianus.AAC.1
MPYVQVKYFNDMDKGPVMLSELRFVGLDAKRVPTVKYIVSCGFDVNVRYMSDDRGPFAIEGCEGLRAAQRRGDPGL